MKARKSAKKISLFPHKNRNILYQYSEFTQNLKQSQKARKI